MDDLERDLASAGDALIALAEGPGREAADSLGRAFDAAGTRIEQALGRAARSGELNFARMAEAVVRDIARVATEAVIAGRGGQGAGSPPVTFNLNLGQGADNQSVMSSRNTIAAALARTVSAGGRFI
ncbi:MAG: phage tail tape measure C-terminal domain-containing protein [Pseudomonadota bacterium]